MIRRFVLPLSLCLLFITYRSPGSDAAYFGITKSQFYVQTTNSPPTVASNGYAFDAFVLASTNGAVTSATVTPPGGAVKTLLMETNEIMLRFEERFSTQAAMDSAYPAGGGLFGGSSYTMSMETVHDGTRNASLNFRVLVVELTYLNTPQIQNLAEAQAIDHTRDFTVQWNALGNPLLMGIVQFLVLDASSNIVFATPAPLQSNALTTASTGTTIPAYSLPPGASLQAHLTVANVGIPATNYAMGFPALVKDTEFTMTTRAAPPAVTLQVLTPALANFTVGFEGEAGRNYHLQVSPELSNWTDLLVTNPPLNGLIQFTDPEASPTGNRFYRVQVGP